MIGKTLSHYKVIEKIGQGGMGEVYRAEDTNLSREVAIKVLPEQFTQDPQRLARFEREAKLLASLNHPNIAAIYGLEEAEGVRFLSLELVPGDTLQEHVAKGPLPVEEALEVCRQIAEGVEAAHEKGVIHRDLKPANVKVTPEGKVKILDFGLAKAFEGEIPAADISQSPTLTEEMTRAGVILGTAAYMSPEQAKGKEVDKRADIFAFGAVLYELLTGKRAFEGETVTDTLASILARDPEWEALPDGTPWRIQDLLRRCLTKDPHDRLDGIANVRVEIKLTHEEPTTVSPIGVTTTQVPLWKRALPWSITAVVIVIAGVSIWNSTRPSPTVSLPVTELVFTLPPTAPLIDAAGSDLVISPDGSRIVYLSSVDSQLYMRPLDAVVSEPISGTQNAFASPFFSPDGEWVAFFTSDEKLKKVPLMGGPAVTLCDAPNSRGGSWALDDTILFGTRVIGSSGGLYRVSAAGGEPKRLLISEPDFLDYYRPQILPGGKAVLFSVAGEGNFDYWIAVLSLETGEPKILIEGRSPTYLPTGHLVYTAEEAGTLMAVPFDSEQLELTGDPVAVLEGVRSRGLADYTFSREGTLFYASGSTSLPRGRPVWVDRTGRAIDQLSDEPIERPRQPRISPDGQQVVLATGGGRSADLWVYDVGGRPPYPLALEQQNHSPIWTTDGKRVIFSFVRPSIPPNLYWIASDGSTLEPEPLLDSPNRQYPRAVSPDGQEVIFTRTNPQTGTFDIMALPLEGEHEPRLVLDTEQLYSNRLRAEGLDLSPDGKWLAYVSGVTGRPEIWVRPYPGPGAPVRISPDGGDQPVWGAKGRELFYLDGDRMMAVRIDTGPELRFEPPQLLFEAPYVHSNIPSYDVTADGRFLMIERVEDPLESTQINVVTNWFEELKRLVPTE